MEDVNSSMTVRRWEDLPTDILLKIFEYLGVGDTDIYDSTSIKTHASYGAICRAWCSILCDWSTLDLTRMKTRTPLPNHYCCMRPMNMKLPLKDFGREPVKLTTLTHFSLLLSLSQGNPRTLIFNPKLCDESRDAFTFAAEWCPKLKRLVMPAWSGITKIGIRNAFRHWKDLESLTMSPVADFTHLMDQISYNCKNFSELKIIGNRFQNASTLVIILPQLKVLSLRCARLMKGDLIIILNGLKQLQVLNISHCVVTEAHAAPHRISVLEKLDQVIIDKASRLQRFITCMQLDHCIMCQRTRSGEGYGYKRLWKEDEVNSLAYC